MTALADINLQLRNGMSVNQSQDLGGVPISRIVTIANGTIDPTRVGFAGLSMSDCDGWLLQAGDILISHINSVKHLGKCAIYSEEPPELVHGMNLLSLRVDQEVAMPRYVYRMMSAPGFRQQIPRITKNSVNQSSFNISSFKKLEIPLPPLAEQKRIAGILDAADALRTKRREALAQLDTLLQSTFLYLFGDPVTNPKGWELARLDTLGTLDRGISKNRPRNEPSLLGGPYPLVQTGDITSSDGYVRKYISTYSEKGLKQSKLWPVGTLCITIAANIANTAILTFESCFPDSVVGFKSEMPGRVEFVQGLFWFLRKILDQQATQVAQKNINLKTLRDLEVPNPPLELQRQFCNVVRSAELQKTSQRRHLAELDALFASLQSRAFRGDL